MVEIIRYCTKYKYFMIDRSVVIPSVSELAELLLCGCMTILRNPSQCFNSTVIPLFHALPPFDPWPSLFAIIYCVSSVVEKMIKNRKMFICESVQNYATYF